MISKESQLMGKLEEISRILESRYSESPQVGVLSGISGISMFFFYYSKLRDVNTYSELGTEILQEVIERINTGYQNPTYCAGIAGAGWVMEHLSEEGFIDIETDQLLPELDDYLIEVMKADLLRGKYDILHGALGYGYYFLKRFNNTQSASLKSYYQAALNVLLDSLEEAAEKDGNGLKWLSIINAKTKEKGYNLSLSHGIASMVNFLSRLARFDEFRTKAMFLLEGAVKFLLNQEKRGDSLFPSIIHIPRLPPDESRLSWCYGDLGIGLSLLLASEVIPDETLRPKALQILKHSTDRKTPGKCGVKDASPCHGAFGIAQIYHSLFAKTGLIEFCRAADHWIDEGLKMAVHPDGYAGYKQNNDLEGWRCETDLLEGVAGIGLVMISHLTDFETHWDECLFIR